MDLETGLAIPRDRIEAHRANCAEVIESRRLRSRNTRFLEGALGVYDWVLGAESAPISGTLEVTAEALSREERLARSAIAGEPGALEVVSQSWAVGVENTVMYLCGTTPEPADGLLPEEEEALYRSEEL